MAEDFDENNPREIVIVIVIVVVIIVIVHNVDGIVKVGARKTILGTFSGTVVQWVTLCRKVETKTRRRYGRSRVFTLYDDAQSNDDDDDSADILEAILGRVGQREDASYDDDGVDVSVRVHVGVVVGVSVNGQNVSLGVGLGVGLVVGSPPLTSLDS